MIFWIMGGYSCCLECCCLIKYALYALSFAGFYHTCTGIRHLIWDTGRGFSIRALHIGGWLSVIVAIALTLGFWMLVV